MLSHWHLYYYHDGNRYTIGLADLPVTGFRLKYASRAADELRLTLEAAPSIFSPADLWQHFERGRSYALTCDAFPVSGGGTTNKPMFYGRLETTETANTGTSRKIVLVFKGGWHYLTLAMYRPNTTSVTLGGNTHTATEWAQYILWLAARAAPGKGIFYPSGSPEHDIPAHIPASVSSLYLPEFTARDITYAQALDAILAFWPDVVSYPAWTAVDLDLASSPCPQLCLGTPSVVQRLSDILAGATDGGDLVSQNVELRPGVPGVRVYAEDGTRSAQIGNPDDLGGLMYTLDPSLAQYAFYWDGFSNRYASEVPYYIYSQTQVTPPEGAVELVGKIPPGLFHLSRNKLLSLEIGESATVMQSIEFDIAQGRAVINFGNPPSVDLDNLVSLIRANFFGSWHFAMNRR